MLVAKTGKHIESVFFMMDSELMTKAGGKFVHLASDFLSSMPL